MKYLLPVLLAAATVVSAAELPVSVPRKANDTAKAEGELSVRIEPRRGGQVGSDRIDLNRSAVEPPKFDIPG